MAVRYVRQDSTHSAVRDGLTYATAWGGFSEVVGGQLTAGSTLWCAGRHLITTSLQIQGHTGTQSQPVTYISYPKDPWIVDVVGSGNVWFGTNKANTIVDGATMYGNDTQAFYIQPNTDNCIYRNCTFVGRKLSAGAIVTLDSSSGSYTNILFENCKFTGTSNQGVRWMPSSTTTPCTITGLKFNNCKFTDLVTIRGIIELRTAVAGPFNASTWMQDISVTKCSFNNVQGIAIEIVDACGNVYGHSSGIQITDNVMNNCSIAAGILGGGIFIVGFAPLKGAVNYIARNKLTNIQGDGGAIDLLFGSYNVVDNTIDTVHTPTGHVDGNGILLDNGCDSCIVTRNTIKNVKGDASATDVSSGYGVLFLQATNCHVYSNIVDKCRIGVGFGNPTNLDPQGLQSAVVSNNLFLNYSIAGYVVGANNACMPNNYMSNNIFTTGIKNASPTYNMRSGLTVWPGEQSNTFYGGTGSGTALPLPINASSSREDPKLDAKTYKLLVFSNCIGAGKFVKYFTTFDNKPFNIPPSKGVYEYPSKKPNRIRSY